MRQYLGFHRPTTAKVYHERCDSNISLIVGLAQYLDNARLVRPGVILAKHEKTCANCP